MVSLADTHCHLDFNAFDADRETVISRAWEKGLKWILNPGIDLETSQKAVEIAASIPGVYAAVGVHPNDALSWDSSTMVQLEELIRHPKVVAIGEIGLDFYRDRTPRDVQKRVFRMQLELAASAHLPVIIHSRQAIDDVVSILEEWEKGFENVPEGRPVGVFHSFEGSLENARDAIRLNCLIGVGGPVTFRNARQKQEIVKSLPLENIILETDAPFLTPHPHRGERNEPAYIPLIAEAIASLHSQPVAPVAEATSLNAARLFAWSL